MTPRSRILVDVCSDTECSANFPVVFTHDEQVSVCQYADGPSICRSAVVLDPSRDLSAAKLKTLTVKESDLGSAFRFDSDIIQLLFTDQIVYTKVRCFRNSIQIPFNYSESHSFRNKFLKYPSSEPKAQRQSSTFKMQNLHLKYVCFNSYIEVFRNEQCLDKQQILGGPLNRKVVDIQNSRGGH